MSLLLQLLKRTASQQARPAPSPRRGEGVTTYRDIRSPLPGSLRSPTSPRWGEGEPGARAIVPLLVLCSLLAPFSAARAPAYPNRPITLVVPYAAGGGNALFARIASERMSRTLGQQIVIENRPGAGGST